MKILSTHPEHFMSCFPFISSEGHLFKYYSFSAFSHHSPNLTGVSFNYILYSVCDPFVLMYLNPLKHLRSFYNSSWCFFIFSAFIFNSYWWFVQDFSSFVIVSIHSFLHPTGGSSKTLSNLCNIYLNPLYKNKWCAKSIVLSSI